MEVTDFDNRQPALSERRLAYAVGQSAKEEFIRPDAEADLSAQVVPDAGAAAKVEAAAVGDETRFDFGVRRAEDNGVVAEVGVDVAERGQPGGEELVAGAVGLAHGQFTPKVGAGSHRLVKRGDRGLSHDGAWNREKQDGDGAKALHPFQRGMVRAHGGPA